MRRRKGAFTVILSKKAKHYGEMSSFGIVIGMFGMCWILISTFMTHEIGVLIGFVLLGTGLFSSIIGIGKYSEEYNNCISNSIYTTILWNEKEEKKYIIIQDGLGEILEINYKPVQKVHQTTGRYVEKI